MTFDRIKLSTQHVNIDYLKAVKVFEVIIFYIYLFIKSTLDHILPYLAWGII